jgi:histidyl-tRNA synthetase
MAAGKAMCTVDMLTGRYDTLLEHFDTGHLPQATTYGVGMSISIE